MKCGLFSHGPEEILCDHRYWSEHWTSLPQLAAQLLFGTVWSDLSIRNEDRHPSTDSFEELANQEEKKQNKNQKIHRA